MQDNCFSLVIFGYHHDYLAHKLIFLQLNLRMIDFALLLYYYTWQLFFSPAFVHTFSWHRDQGPESGGSKAHHYSLTSLIFVIRTIRLRPTFSFAQA